MDNALSAVTSSAITQGIARNTSPEREAERATARAIKAEQDAKLKRITSQSTDGMVDMETESIKQELITQQQKNKNLQLNLVKTRTYEAFDRFSVDSDPRHLTTLIQDLKRDSLPSGPLANISRVDKLSELDSAELERIGFDPTAVLASPEARATLVRTTDINGEVGIRSVDRLKAFTGYSRYATGRELDEQRKRIEMLNLLRKGSSTGGQGGFAKSKDEREAARIVGEEFPDLETGSDEYVERFNDEYAAIIARNRQTAPGKQEDKVDQAISEIDGLASNKYNADFFDLPMDDSKVRRVFERKIERIERLGKLDLSESEKKKIGQIKQLISISRSAKDLSEEDTGIFDRYSKNVRKYVNDKVDGVAATSAYSAYRNILRNALYGSVLTEGEMRAFKDQFGDLTQKTGPVLVQFATALSQLQGEMQALLDTNNSYVMHFRVGSDQDELQKIVDGLQDRIDFFTTEADKPFTTATNKPAATTVLSDEDIMQLDAIATEVGVE